MSKDKEKKKDILDEILICPECNSKHLIRDYRHGELVCESCGLVIDENYVDMGPEWRDYSADQSESKSRTGAPTTYTIHDKGYPLKYLGRIKIHMGSQYQPEIKLSCID